MGGYHSLPTLNPPADPVRQFSEAMTVRSMMQGEQMQKIQLQQAQQHQKDAAAYTAALPEWDAKDPKQLSTLILKHGGSGAAAESAAKNLYDQQAKFSQIAKDDAETGSKNLETLQKKNDMVRGAINTAMDVPDEELAQHVTATAQQLVQQGLLDPQHAQQIPQLAQLDPKSMRRALALFNKGYMSESQQLTKAKEDADIAAKNAALPGQQAEATEKQLSSAAQYMNGISDQGMWTSAKASLGKRGISQDILDRIPDQYSPAAAASVRQMGVTPQQAANVPTDVLSRQAWLAKNPGKDANDYDEHMKKVAPAFNFNLQNSTAGGLKDAALDNAAEKYWSQGVLPAGGRGPAVMAQNQKIMNRAAELHSGESITEGSAAYKANQASLVGLQKNLDAVSAFENAAKKNIDLLLTQSKKVLDSGSPWINQPLRAIDKNALGNEDLSALNAARQVAVNEIAKVTSSPSLTGQLSDSARHEIETFIPQEATYAQTVRVAEVLKQDMANRHQSYQEQIDDIKGRLGGKPATNNTPPSTTGGFDWNSHPKVNQ